MSRRRTAMAVLTAVPGLLALVCAVLGVGLLFGWAYALLAAVPFLLAADWRMPDPDPARNQGDV